MLISDWPRPRTLLAGGDPGVVGELRQVDNVVAGGHLQVVDPIAVSLSFHAQMGGHQFAGVGLRSRESSPHSTVAATREARRREFSPTLRFSQQPPGLLSLVLR